MSVVPCEYAGRTYSSLTAVAHAFGLGLETCRQRLRKGMPLEAPCRSGRKPRACEYHGRQYACLSDFARAEKLSLRKARALIEISGKWIEEGK